MRDDKMQDGIIPIIDVPSSICEECIYGGGHGFYARECTDRNEPSPLDVDRPEDCDVYKGIVQRKYEEDFWRLEENDEQYRLEQENLMDDGD